MKLSPYLHVARLRWILNRQNMIRTFTCFLFLSFIMWLPSAPYFLFVHDLVSSLLFLGGHNGSCMDSVNDIVWNVRGEEPNVSYPYSIHWSWGEAVKARTCGLKTFSKSEALELLKNFWIVVAGDSQSRLFMQSLLILVADEQRMELTIKKDLFKRHSDYEIFINETGSKLVFMWAPFATELTNLMSGLLKNKQRPDVLLMGGGLWDMLHATDMSSYGTALRSLRDTASAYESHNPAPLFWLGMPALINSKLNTQEKREKMTDETWGFYDKVVRESGILHGYGGSFVLIDVGYLTRSCGSRCTIDGMHYHGAIYDATVHAFLNALSMKLH